MDRKFVEFQVHLTLQFNVWPSTVHFLSEFKCWLSGSITFKYKLEFNHFGLFRLLWFLAFYLKINFKIWISFDQLIWRFPLRCSFRAFSDLWFSIIDNKSSSYPKITNSISINFISSLVSKYIIFVMFWHFWFSDFTEHRLLVKVNALTLTFDFSLSNPRFQFWKFLI